jgi:HSP20 family molecular chaperone IbpA
VQGRQLTVQGARRDWFVEEECSCYQMEIAYTHFQRTIALPCDIDPGRIRTDYQDGLLLVHILTEDEK